jgi:hypothetical protein
MRRFIATIVAATALVAVALPAQADVLDTDADVLTTSFDRNITLEAHPGETIQFTLRLVITCQQKAHMGASATFTPASVSTPTGGSLTIPSVTINRPAAWPADGTSCPSPDPQTAPVDITVGVTAPSTAVTSVTSYSYSFGWTSSDGDVLATGQSNTNITLRVSPATATDTTPPVLTPVISGTEGSNGWYTSNSTVTWTVTDPESTPTVVSGCGVQSFTTETAGALSSCNASSAGGTSSSSVSLKIDKTGPSAALSPTGTLGTNGWYTSDVNVATSGSDTISGPVTCTPSQSFTNEGASIPVAGSCTNSAGLTTNASGITLKIDKTAPEATLAVTAGTAGTLGWYTSNVTVGTTGDDLISGIVSCTLPQTLVTETTGTPVNGSCTNGAGLTAHAAPLDIKIDKTLPSASLSVVDGVLSNGWYTSPVTVRTSGADTVAAPVDCTDDQPHSTDTASVTFNGSCTNDAGLVQHADPLTIKVDTTPPSAALQIVGGTAGANGWYTSNVTVRTVGADPTSGVSCTADQVIATETDGIEVTGSCTNGAGMKTDAAPITLKLDKTGPTAQLAVTAGNLGSNGWYISDVTVSTSGTDPVSGPVTCTAAQHQTAETAGEAFSGQCSNAAGLSTPAGPLTVKLDKSAPSALLTATGTPGANGWFTGDVTVSASGTDSISGPVTCTADQHQTTETAGEVFAGRCTNDAGLFTNAAPLTVKLDKTGPSASLAVTAGTLGENGWYTSDVTVSTSGSDSVSGPVTCTADQLQTAETAGRDFNGRCTNRAGLFTDASPLTVKLDKTGPSAALAVTAGTAGTNGWYTTDVTVTASGVDSISGPVTCTSADVTEDTEGTTVNGSCENQAGLSTDADPLTVKLDETDPTATLTVVSGTLGNDGWYTSPVTVRATGADNVAEPVSCSPFEQTQSSDTESRTFEATCTNDAGRQEGAAKTVKIDTSPPTAELRVVRGTEGANGWYTSDVTVNVVGVDPTSGAVCDDDVVVDVETDGVTVTGSCTNGAGLTTDADPLVIKLDKTGPSAALAVSAGTPGTNGWYTSDVTVSASGTDAVSGGVTCVADQHQTTETAGAVFNGSCTNSAGLSTPALPLTVKLDESGPSALLTATGTEGDNGWFVSDVTVTTSGTDSISQPVTCTSTQLLMSDSTGAPFEGSCTNDAGLETDAAGIVVRRDVTRPDVSVTGVTGPYTLGAAPTAGCSTTDATSGVATHATATVTGGNANGVGTFDVLCAGARDRAGNTRSASGAYRVLYGWDGFRQPINDTAHQVGVATSVFKAGSTVPVKLQLKRADGTVVQAVTAPQWIVPVRGSSMSAPVDETVYGDSATSGSTYRWDATAQQYIYNWGTAKSGVGSYWRIGVRLDDGQTYYVNIGLR